ncbi:MAG TPA: D-tagatose-bisphosphate aldolase, class II, non-catalytic subunit [Edaphobacter sp.]|uniref:D-tagatose-bisphosphate aldolase, class II, non-catalytic subunit n=1 Tax=Edaphobacter sp. TaxID=1934404 RepID=UPI002C65BC28|nr:D-tagatose-bisphosphate aldolase, class II, non-catalytic subunit [Edaphobacter sp.]HUZ93570.1 D-tagatose-bisphosphate aldolase, class II, non-catalytic subunit [Edaphobacter sp.]
MSILQQLSSSFLSGLPIGIYSVCSAHPLVLEAAVRQAVVDRTPLLIEATSNQVNQFGGYTGMRPADFREFALRIATAHGLPVERLILGGDHLGPNPWQHLPADDAMQHAQNMVAEYSRAGFTKIHLDASMACLGEQTPLPDSVVAERAARLCRAAEEASGGQPRYYVIGTEVPVPGGATESLAGLEVTTYAHAARTLQIHREIFFAAGLGDVWPRVIALVVQPGVEFNHDSVVDYDSSKTVPLRRLLRDDVGLVFEAHSTDYQRPRAYKELVSDGFPILKVGPALTFALREVLFALQLIENELVPAEKCSNLSGVVERQMLLHPAHWVKHYHGTSDRQRLLRRYSYSDRIRYYWTQPEIQAAVNVLMSNLEGLAIPETLLSAEMPPEYLAVREGSLRATPHELIIHRIQQAIRPYAAACIRN